MKHLEIYAHGAAYPKLGSGFAVTLLSLNHRWERSFASGNYKANTACLMAVKFGLLSIAKAAKDLPVKVFTNNNYVVSMFKKDDEGFYKCSPNANADLIEEIRVLTSDIDVEITKDTSEVMDSCKKLVEAAVKDNSPIDNRK